MPDELDRFHPPPGSSPDYQFGMLFEHASRTNSRFREMQTDLGSLRDEVAAIPENIKSFVTSALEQQTAELKPLITEKIVRDANAKAQADADARLTAQSSVSQARSARWMLVATVIVWVIGGIWVVRDYVHFGDEPAIPISNTK